ncbi:MAG: heavy metal-associated domain-containing protein [Pseudomonadales bacterium]|nr:heavy metal-associated domain-containing protein [Pseudomonadales bacterium]
MFIKLTAMALLYTLLIPFSFAQHHHDHNHEIEEQLDSTHNGMPKNYYVVNVHGIVCELCAYGVAKNIRKLPFINAQHLEKGVSVDVKNQRVFITVREDIGLDKTALFKAIEDGGYKPIDVTYISDTHITSPEEVTTNSEASKPIEDKK